MVRRRIFVTGQRGNQFKVFPLQQKQSIIIKREDDPQLLRKDFKKLIPYELTEEEFKKFKK